MYEIDQAPLSVTLDSRDREHDLRSESVHQAADEYAAQVDAPSLAAQLPAVLRGLDVSKVETRTDFVRELSRTLPLNEYNLPIYVYRPDLLDPMMLIGEHRAEAKQQLGDMLTASIVYVSYDHGYPTLKGDLPFWGRMEWETASAHQAFLQYLELDGARGIHRILNVTPDLLSEWFVQNYWLHRAKAYDSYKLAHHARLREKRIFEVQDDHYLRSQKIFKRVADRLDNVELDDVDADKLVNMMSKLADVTQKALGMGNNGGLGKDGQIPTGTSVEVVMKRTAETQQIKRAEDNSLVDMEGLLNDPDALAQAQELIIRVNR